MLRPVAIPRVARNATAAAATQLGRGFQWDGILNARVLNAPSVYSGSGAPRAATLPGAVKQGDIYLRIDTGSNVAPSRYVCTSGGAAGSSVWAPTPGTAVPAKGGAGIAGTLPAVGTSVYYWQGDSTIVTLNGFGDASVTFPTPFLAGIATIVVCNGDATNGPAETFSVNQSSSAPTLSGFTVHGSTPSVTRRINYMALGA